MRVGEVDERESERRVEKKLEIKEKLGKRSRGNQERKRKGGERRWKELACLAQEYKEK